MRLENIARSHWRLRSVLSGLLVLGTLLLAMVLFTVSRSTSAASNSTPDVDISADSRQLSPGDTFAVKIRVTNPFTTTLNKITIKLNYDSDQVNPIDSDFHHDSDWVSDLNDHRVTVTFKNIDAGKSRTGKIVFHVNQAIPGNTSVSLRAKYNWSVYASTNVAAQDGSGSTSGKSLLIVAPDGVLTDPNVIDSVPQTAINPTVGAIGTQFHAYASGFKGGERISIWLNTPSGVAAVPHNLFANSKGEVWPEFSSDNLVAGNYGLVVYGQESTQTLVIPFTVNNTTVTQPVGQPAAQPVTQPVTQPSVPWTSEPAPLWGNDSSVPAQQPAAPAPTPGTNIEPKSANAGTRFHAYASGFNGNEGISIWLNTPSGVQALDGSFTTNSTGETWPDFSSSGLAPGAYELVVYGRESQRTFVIPFTILP